jgi:molybdopterin-binding protein
MNILKAAITSVTTSEHLSCLGVAVGEDTFYLLLAEASNEKNLLNTPVTLAFKETEVILSVALSAATANMQRAIVQTIERGIILSQVTLTYHETTIMALVPTVTFNTLSIREGAEVCWMVQPSEISLLRETHGI